MKLILRLFAALVVISVVAACGGDSGPTEVEDDRHLFRYVPRAGGPNITSINVAGSFNDWNSTVRPMVRQSDGTWQARVRLGPGTYEYKYVFNGDQWAQNMCSDAMWGNPANGKVDPAVTTCIDDPFGGANAVLVIP